MSAPESKTVLLAALLLFCSFAQAQMPTLDPESAVAITSEVAVLAREQLPDYLTSRLDGRSATAIPREENTFNPQEAAKFRAELAERFSTEFITGPTIVVQKGEAYSTAARGAIRYRTAKGEFKTKPVRLDLRIEPAIFRYGIDLKIEAALEPLVPPPVSAPAFAWTENKAPNIYKSVFDGCTVMLLAKQEYEGSFFAIILITAKAVKASTR